jgi:hypothetical protein
MNQFNQPMFGGMSEGNQMPRFGDMGGNRSSQGHPKPTYPGHPNHPDYKPGPGNYDPNDPSTHPSPPPRIPSLLEHWQHRDEIEQFGRGVKEWLQGNPAIPGSQATPPPDQQEPQLTEDDMRQLIWRPFEKPKLFPSIPGDWWLEDPRSPLLTPWSPTP